MKLKYHHWNSSDEGVWHYRPNANAIEEAIVAAKDKAEQLRHARFKGFQDGVRERSRNNDSRLSVCKPHQETEDDLQPATVVPQATTQNEDDEQKVDEQQVEDQQARERRGIEIAFLGQRSRAAGYLSLRIPKYGEEESLAMMLLDPTISLTPLFRYCTAVQAGNPRRFKFAMNHYRKPAITQYMQAQEHYDDVWKDWIPEEFRKEAPAVHEASVSILKGLPTSSELKRNIYK